MNLIRIEIKRVQIVFAAATLITVIAFTPSSGFAQANDTAKLRAEAFRLINEQKFTDALPLLEKLAIATPKDPDVQRNLGFALLGQAKNTPDAAGAKQLRARSRAAFVKARESGDDSQLVSGLIDSIAPDGGEDSTFTSHSKADEIMQKAEAAFSSGKMDEALALYQEALKLDPKLYYAALFSGDVYTHKEKFADAETWYQRAITIDPFIETAYRYSATPLMKQGKYEQARDRYIEAWIVEPYSKFAVQ
jgi:tetratricopeptide (TPR) repeat protein